jgi:hypothetical protein
MPMTRFASLLGVLILAPSVATAPLGAQSLLGSRSSVSLMHQKAIASGLRFYKSPTGVKSAAENGRFVQLAGNANYKIEGASYPYALSETRLFVERLSAQYRSACGEQLVVTGAIRPATAQPANASKYSVHPTGMAVDLRRPKGKCLTWLRATLLSLEGSRVLEATEEKSPPHFHVAVFPAAYGRYVRGRLGAGAGN